jgi:hypothetical protein
LLAFTFSTLAAPTTAELKNLSVNGGIDEGKARITIEANINGLPGDSSKMIFAASLTDLIKISRDKLTQSITATIDILQGTPTEIAFNLKGDSEIREVTGTQLQDWSVRQETNGVRTLVLRIRKTDKPLTQVVATITADRELGNAVKTILPLGLSSTQPAFMSGYVKVEFASEMDVQPQSHSGLVPLEPKFLPAPLRSEQNPDDAEPLAFRFQGSDYSLPLRIGVANPEQRRVVLHNAKLIGQLTDKTASFVFTATAQIKNPAGGRMRLLSGNVALTSLDQHPGWRVLFEQEQFVLVFDRAGEFPIKLEFNAAVRTGAEAGPGWSTVDFRLVPSALQPITLKGLAANTQFQFPGAARPERQGTDFVSFLPSDGAVRLSWKQGAADAEGKLFYSAEMLSQITISPGLMRQIAVLDFKVMQGELSRVTLQLQGSGEVTRVQGDQVLAWNVTPVPNSTNRQLVIQFNQAQKDQFSVQVQMQTALGAFPQTANAMQLHPEGATRFTGYLRIVNEGAVRLEVAQSKGLSQISPEQFPESDATRAAMKLTGSQRFAYRFSGADFGLRIQADQILPELTVSEILAYQLGQNELAIDAEIELDIREAPLRELVLRVPKGFAIAKLTASNLSDYFLREPEGETNAELRLVYGQPLTGRQVVQLRLERNKGLAETTWVLPRIDVPKAKSVRGQIAVATEPGFRLTAERTQGLTEIATAFFPGKIAGIQAAFRLSDPLWQASLQVERLPQTVQADVFHLFSIGEGIAYGSSVLNYTVSGAPVSSFRLELSPEYFNVEFTGKDIRSWQKTNGTYVVQLHTPVSGSFTLLATYERPFKPQGETLTFTGVRPVDAQTEQGHTIIISAYQFHTEPVEVSPNLLALETGEVPAEYRLFFDAPILAAYRYNTRPFNLKLALRPLAQGDSLSQVVDRASLTTHISKEGQVITDARYFVKNRGNPNFRITLPPGTDLWSATVNDAPVVPVADAQSNLIPLPQRADPNAVLKIDLKLASRSKDPKRVAISAPKVNAPVLLAEWKLAPDTNQRLTYRSGSLTPVDGISDFSGFAGLARTFKSDDASEAFSALALALVLLTLALVIWRWTVRHGVYRSSRRTVLGAFFGGLAFAIAIAAFLNLAGLVARQSESRPIDVTLLAPIQLASSALDIEVNNTSENLSALNVIGYAWPAILALAVWFYGWRSETPGARAFGWIAGWTLLGWAALRCPNGAPAFLVIMVAFLFLQVAVPVVRRLRKLPPKPAPTVPPSGIGPAPAVAALLLIAGMSFALAPKSQAAESQTITNSSIRAAKPPASEPPLASSVTQTIRVEEKFALATARIHWQAIKGQTLPILFDPAVLTHMNYPSNALKLVQGAVASKRAQQLFAQEGGAYDIELQYQLQVTKRDAESGLVLPVHYGLINQLVLTVANLDVEVVSPQAVSIAREKSGSNTVATLILSPTNGAWVAWHPRTRNLKGEKPVFYTEFSQLYVPSSGIVEGAHIASIRPAQGELDELVFKVPAGATITDVFDPAQPAGPHTNSFVSLWRFDPDTRKLRVTLNPPQSRPFTVTIRSQVTTGPLPFEQSIGLLTVENAADQIGMVGIATGNDVQLDNVSPTDFSVINLEDFPTNIVALMQPQFPGLTLRRAFRYSATEGTLEMKASAVEPDVRVETRDTLSLGEDRMVLASEATVNITRAGIFRLSFVIPTGFDVESISGAALSHWTESKVAAGRLITLNLKGKTEGQQQFAISLAGPGIKATNNWPVPQLAFREASKQRGTLVIAPEQGMRLQVSASEGLTQLDPQKSGIRQKGVLAFNILQTPWTLALGIEQVDPWIQVTSLQHATVTEAQVKVLANLQYQIENTGLKALHVFIPTNAESVRFTGDQVADFLKVPNVFTNGLQQWEIKLHRRIIGAYALQVTYQTISSEQASETLLRGILAAGVNLQRGFVTIQSGGRLQVIIDNVPSSLQPAEWQSIPRTLQRDLQAASANFAYRLVEPSFQLVLKLQRHDAAKLLPARVNNISFTSVISDDGVMLTQVHLEMVPGDKRLLNLTLPKDAQFWFAFVNQNGVWPWREAEKILIPLEQQSRGGTVIPVEFFFSCRIGEANRRSLDLELFAPKFDLPLENLTWRVSLSEKWTIKHWSGSLQLAQEEVITPTAAADLQTYLENEANIQRERTKEAEQFMTAANNALAQGDPQQARRAFQTAYGLSTHDAAFNEDARVQLHNLKLQEALVGLNVRQGANGGDNTALPAKLRDQRGKKDVAYTQQDAKDLIDRNSADDNNAYMKLAERIIQQQDAAVTSPAAIRAAVPEQGRVLTFKRAVVIDPWANLRIHLKATAARVASWALRFLILAGTAVFLGLCAWMVRSLRVNGQHP